MADYKVNGYDLVSAFGIIPDADYTTADSFEKPADPAEVFSHTWEDGVVEYDLQAPVQLKPRLFTIKGTLLAATLSDYAAIKLALNSILYENYVTLEMVDLGIKANAKLKGGASWHRITNLSSAKIAVQVQFQFDEVLQDAPFKDAGSNSLTFMVDNEGHFITTPQGKYITLKK